MAVQPERTDRQALLDFLPQRQVGGFFQGFAIVSHPIGTDGGKIGALSVPCRRYRGDVLPDSVTANLVPQRLVRPGFGEHVRDFQKTLPGCSFVARVQSECPQGRLRRCRFLLWRFSSRILADLPCLRTGFGGCRGVVNPGQLFNRPFKILQRLLGQFPASGLVHQSRQKFKAERPTVANTAIKRQGVDAFAGALEHLGEHHLACPLARLSRVGPGLLPPFVQHPVQQVQG